MGQLVGGYGSPCNVASAGYGPGHGQCGFGGSFLTSTGVILVLFILLVIVSRSFI